MSIDVPSAPAEAERAFAAGFGLVATDLDGTIVRPDQTVAPRTLEAFRACAEAGVHVVLVTGRPMRWTLPVAEQVPLTGRAVCANGAVICDLAREEVVERRALEPDAVREVARRLRAVAPETALALESGTGFRREGTYVPKFDAGLEQEVGTLDELLEQDPCVLKVLARCEGLSSDELLDLARGALDGIAHATHSSPGGSLVEIAAVGVSKASTLADVAASLGVPREGVAAFGDMPNDAEMLAWAGRGYAMADGHAEAAAAAAALAPPCAEDGVAQVVERLLALRSA